ncbi:MAG: hydroxysqualene dehydroxylase HpnE [Burkholderiaceae bacterium]
MRQAQRVAVVGAGWSGIAAAVEATLRGDSVTLFEMAQQCGGRARGFEIDGVWLDNGQHIMIGAYTEVLRLMRAVGADETQLLLRTPLILRDAAGKGLELRPGPALVSFAQAVARHPAWRWRDKLALMAQAARWATSGFACDESLDVATLTEQLPPDIRRELIDPLCLAALNTPSSLASASVFLRVLRDSLFAVAGASDLLLPKVSLSELFPEPALRWLRREGAVIRPSTRIHELRSAGESWSVDAMRFDRVVLATPPLEAARLAQPHSTRWAQIARDMSFEPIVTVYAHSSGTHLAGPMLALQNDADRPAQFVFDRGQLGGPEGLLAFVVSGAADWVERGTSAVTRACLAQATEALALWLRGPLQPVQVLTEKRATFRCIPRLARPSMQIVAGLCAAGDYVAGPYPATLEGAVRSGVNAIRVLE